MDSQAHAHPGPIWKMHKNVVEWESSEVRGTELDRLESLGLHS